MASLKEPLVDPEAAQVADAVIAENQRLSEKYNLSEYDVTRAQGFFEKTYRLLWDFEDKFPAHHTPEGGEGQFQLFTILKEGNVENRKGLKSKKGKALIAFGFQQSIDKSKLVPIQEAWKNRKQTMLEKYNKAEDKDKEDIQEKYASYPGDEPDDIPFFWKREDNSYALVQTWTVGLDDTFKKRFRIMETNPAVNKFHPGAVEDFQKAMVKLFGLTPAQALTHRVKFCMAQQKNEHPLYVGLGKDLIRMLKDNQEIRDEMQIFEVGESHFVGKIVNFDWKTQVKTEGVKDFSMTPDTLTALYMKAGGDKMPSVKPWDLFLADCVIYDENTKTIPPVLLTTPIPDMFIDDDVVELFLERKDRLGDGIEERPYPIPISECVGLAIKYAYLRGIFIWVQVVICTYVAKRYMTAEAMNAESPSAAHFYGLWSCFGVSVLVGLYCELMCVKYFVVPWVQQVHGCLLPLWGPIEFKYWLASMMVASCTELLSIQSNALFFAMTYSREHAYAATQGNEGVAPETALWASMMSDSMFRNFPGMIGQEWTTGCKPGIFCGIAWLISTVQFWGPLINTCPADMDEYNKINTRVEYNPEFDAAGKPQSSKKWKTFWNKYLGVHFLCTFYEAFVYAAHMSGMATVGCIVFSYPQGQMKEAVRMKNPGWETKSIDCIRSAQRAAIRKIVIDVFMKKTLQLKLQVSLYGIQRASNTQLAAHIWGDFLWIRFFQICITFAVGLFTHLDILNMCWSNYTLIKEALEGRVENLDEAARRSYNQMHRANIVILVMGALAMWIISYSMIQLFLLHGCKVSLWNMKGCAYDDSTHIVVGKMTDVGFNTTEWLHGK